MPLSEILHKIPCLGENHGKNGLLFTDFLIRHIRQSFTGESGNVMKPLKNWWLSDSEVRQVAIPYMFSPFPPYVSLCFTHCFRSFFGYFPCFPWCFLLFPILGLTYSKDVSGRNYLILRVKHLVFLKYKRKGIYSKFIATILNNHWSKFLLTQYRFRI